MEEQKAEAGWRDRSREAYMDGDGFIHEPLMLQRTETLDDGQLSQKPDSEMTDRGVKLLNPDIERTKSRRRAIESGLWEIGSKETSLSDSDAQQHEDRSIRFKTDAEEQKAEKEEFTPLTTPLLDSKLDFMNDVTFSNRGSVLLSGKKALEVKKKRERIMKRANRRSLQDIVSDDNPEFEVADSSLVAGASTSASITNSAAVDEQAQNATTEPAVLPRPLSPPEVELSTLKTTDGALTLEPARSAPPTSEPTREAPAAPVPDIEPPTQRVREFGEEPQPEISSISPPRPATPAQRPQSSPEPSRIGSISGNPLLTSIAAMIEPEPILVKQLEARPRMPSQRHTMPKSPSIKTLSQEIEAESLKVRSMYEAGTADMTDWRNGSLVPPSDAYEPRTSPVEEQSNEDVFASTTATPNRSTSTLRQRPHTAHPSSSTKRESVLRRENELAGGIEDWEGVESQRVDRYGFIVEPPSRKTSLELMAPPPPPQRVATTLQLASEQPRQGIFNRRPSVVGSTRNGRSVDPRSSSRSLRTQATDNSTGRSPQRTRTLINRLPGMRGRRVMDEAGDMLTLPPGLSNIAEPSPAVLEAQRRTEARRAEKWRKMARVVKIPPTSSTTSKETPTASDEAAEPKLSPGQGGGMHFTFNTSDPKLISRVWKGIPDRWRATAWHSFLETSAKSHPTSCSATEAELIDAFHELVDCSSADDVQIDMDVPRTINSHIMFRSRYRGGQRLLFRVLHCLSLYFPETGYVQGMASLAATLLCYYAEDMAFVIAVRMWELRGLKKLYAPGFEGLMSALDEFREEWLQKGNSEVSKQLDDMGIHPTAYGTRWYLTLFNYSVPFETQLRVWDLFMLLGDETPCPPGHNHTSLESKPHQGIGSRPSSTETGQSPNTNPDGSAKEERYGFHGQLDILHAAGCAIIDGTRERFLNSDFENVMKTLTSWVPVQDEEIFIRVVRVEWRRHGRK